MTVGGIVPGVGPIGGNNTWDDGDYRYHEWLEAGTLDVPFEIDVDVLLQDSGGGGGRNVGGGGAGGAQREVLDVTLTPGTVDVVVAAGVAGSVSNSARGSTGERSSFGTLETVGGGGGGGGSSSEGSGGDGGSGGGGALRNSNPGGTGTVDEGHDGGSGAAGSGGDASGGGGGVGGAGEDGSYSSGSGQSGDGGPGGVPSGWSSVPTMGAGGGGGGFSQSSTAAGDATDGGGAGGAVAGSPGANAQANRGGGGGGGGSSNSDGGASGSGRVVIRYLLSDLPFALQAGADSHFHGQVLTVADLTGWSVDADSRAHRLAQIMRADLPDPEVETWRVELLDRETWQPPAGVGPDMAPVIDSPPTWELSSVAQWGFTVGPGAPLAAVLRGTERPPDLTARLWRGPEIIDQGPVTDIAVDPADGWVKVTVESIWHHMVRSTIGPAETDNILTNPAFSQGLAGWMPVQTDSLEGFPFLVPVTPGAVSVVAPGGSRPGTPTGRGRWARLRGDLTDPQSLSISQVHRGVVSPTDRDIMIRALAVFYLPNGAAERTNQNIAVAIGAYPTGYSFPEDSFVAAAEAHRAGTQRIAEWPEPAAQGRFIAISEQVTLRAGSGVRDVVVTIGAPFADCLVTGTFATVSDALVAQGTVTDVVDALVEHGQDDEILGHVDHGISVTGVEQGELPHLDEQWGWHDHTGIGSAVDGLVSGGLGEWRVVHHMTGSTVEVLSRDIDGVLADTGERLDIAVTDRHRPPWVASLAVRNDWAAGSTTVVAQSAGVQAFHERGAVADDPLGWTDVVTMPDHVPPWRAGPWAQRLLELAGKRGQVLVHYGEDAPRAWHRLRPGARCQVHVDVEGVQVSGRMLVRSHQLRPGAGGVLSLTEVE